MIICLNPNCQKPENPDGTNFCLSCGTGLVPLLRDRYRIISLLGSGGFGRTFLAQDTGMPSARRCVIKQLKPINHNPQIYQLVQERFQREAAVLEQLGEENSHIPSLYDYFTNAGQFYLVQQWIDGETLTNIIQQQGILSEIYVRGLITKVLEILDYVHSKGIIHRDIKPDNIIVRRRDGFPVLIDFGAVKEIMGTMVTSQGVPTSSIVIGTPGYMPSEQAAGKPVRSSDLYSFGLTAIYALTGKIPQEFPLDQDTGDIIWHDLAENVSPELIAILYKAIQWHPRDRYSKAKDMLDALHSGVLIQPSPQPSVSHSTPTVPISPTQQPVSHSTSITGGTSRVTAPLAASIEYREQLPNGVVLEMVAIPAGSFLMGSPDGEGSDNERPQHQVKVPGFYMGKYPVTNAQWKVVMGTDPSSEYNANFGGSNQPVINVSWNDAQKFCQKLSSLSGRKYRLPTEAEWEYACRAESQKLYSFGNNANQLKEYAWYSEKSNSQTQLVGKKKANGFGIYDMHGNVWEWCEDEWHGNYNGAPSDGSAWVNKNENRSQGRLLRGGSWGNYAYLCRSACRVRYDADDRYYYIGFRVVCS